MKKFKKYSLWFFILLFFLIISGCGIGRPFHGGHHGIYYYDYYGEPYGQNSSHFSKGSYWE